MPHQALTQSVIGVETCRYLVARSLRIPLGYLQFHTFCLTYLGCSLDWFGILLERIFSLLGFTQGWKYWPEIWSLLITLLIIMAQLDQLFALLTPGFLPLLLYPYIVIVQ